jgi:hypothetical protein
LTATATSSSQINLSWNTDSGASNGYIIERSPNGSTGWTQVGTTAAGTTAYSDTGLAANTTYYYEVIAVNAAGDSPASNIASATTQGSSSNSTNVIIDNGQSGYSETGTGWQSWPTGYNGNHDYHGAGMGADTAVWQASNLAAGTYTVSATWLAGSNHASNATYQIYDGNGNLLASNTVNQQPAPTGTTINGSVFQKLATVTLSSPGSIKVVLSDKANGNVFADAVQIAPSSSSSSASYMIGGGSGGASATMNVESATNASPAVSGTSMASLTSGTPGGVSAAPLFVRLDGGDLFGMTNGRKESQTPQPGSVSSPVILGDGPSGSSKAVPGWQGGATGYDGGARHRMSNSGDDTAS